MATSFPTGLDALVNPTAGTARNAGGGLSHASQHANANDAIEALQTKVGVTDSSATASLDFRSTYVCTSSTRPTAVVGRRIYETDTGNELYYYGATTGWKPPWGSAWGRLALPSTTTGRTSIAATPTITDTPLTVTFTETLNRLVRVTCFGQVQVTTGTTFQHMVLYLRTAAGGVLNTTSIVNQELNYSNGVNFQHVYTSTASGALTLKLSATRSAGTETQWFGARTAISGTDPFTTGTAYMLVEDIGPATTPPVS